MLGAALLGQKKYSEAEPLLLAGYQGMKEREAKIPAPYKIRLVEALERLVQLYEATGNETKRGVAEAADGSTEEERRLDRTRKRKEAAGDVLAAGGNVRRVRQALCWVLRCGRLADIPSQTASKKGALP